MFRSAIRVVCSLIIFSVGLTLNSIGYASCTTLYSALNTSVNITVNNTCYIIDQTGSITTGAYAVEVTNATGVQIRNDGIITSNQYPIFNSSGSISSFVNNGTINSQGYSLFNWNMTGNGSQATISSLINTGTINTTGMFYNVFNWWNNSITDFTNIGNISGSAQSQITNMGTMSTLNNLQGVGNLSGALTYSGNLPINYNIIINGITSYGQLSVSDASGPMNFGIYGGALGFTPITYISSNGGTSVVLASTVTAYRYLNVLQGFSSLSGVSGTSGTYSRYNYSLVADAILPNSWDLLLTPIGPTQADTQLSLQLLAKVLKGVYALQTSAISNGLTYDCNVFDKEGICVSAGGRYDRVNTGDTHATNGLLIGSYKVDANTRVGAWVDQNLSASSATGVNLNNGNPMFGVFGVWNADKSGYGFEARLSAGYGDKDLTTARQVVGSSEAGTGKTRLNTQGVSAVISYNFPVASDVTVSPYLGARYTRVNANAYVEAVSSDVTTPLTYSGLKQETTSALAGLKFSARVLPELGVFGSLGAELDTSNKGNSYSATGVDGLTDIALNSDVKRLRGVASIGAYYDIDKTQRISLNAVYREEAFQKVNTLSTMATYMVGF